MRIGSILRNQVRACLQPVCAWINYSFHMKKRLRKVNYVSTLLKQNALRDQPKKDLILEYGQGLVYTEYINIILDTL